MASESPPPPDSHLAQRIANMEAQLNALAEDQTSGSRRRRRRNGNGEHHNKLQSESTSRRTWTVAIAVAVVAFAGEFGVDLDRDTLIAVVTLVATLVLGKSIRPSE